MSGIVNGWEPYVVKYCTAIGIGCFTEPSVGKWV